jgi:curved DNA-binding protein CbpA
MSAPSQEGRFAGAHHLALLVHLAEQGASGTLEIRAGGREALIVWLAGRLLWAETNDPGTSAARALASAGVMDRGPLAELGRVCEDEDTLMERVAERTGQRRAALEALRVAAVRARIGGCLLWPQGQWRFVAAPQNTLGGVDPRLLPDLELPGLFWEAARSWLPLNVARAELLQPGLGPWRAGPACAAALSRLRLPPGLRALPALLDQELETEAILGGLDEALGESVPLLWMLERAGWAWRAERGPTPPSLPEPLPAVGLGAGLAAPALGPLSAARRSLHERWMRRHKDDLYELLGVRPYASGSSIERAAKDRVAEWGPLEADPSATPEERKVAAALCAAVASARHTLSDEARREDYERDRKRGAALHVAELLARLGEGVGAPDRVVVPAGPLDLGPARQRIQREDFIGALNLLEPMVEAFPDEPDVAAEYAWVIWNLSEHADYGVDPVLVLQRVLAKDPTHPRARAVWDRIQAAGPATATTPPWRRSR